MSDKNDTKDTETSGLTEEQFAEACEQYELGSAGVTDLADKYGVSRQALWKRFKNNGIKKGARLEEIKRAAEEAEKKAAERFSTRRADWIEETRISGIQSLKQIRMLTQKTVIDAVKAKSALSTIDDDLKSLQRFNKIIIENLSKALDILNADEHVDEDDLPSLVIEDLTDQEILDHHKMTGVLPEDATVDEMLAEELYTDGDI
jgi:predicted DNA binding protein